MLSTLTSLFSYSPPCATFLVPRYLGCGLASGKKLCAPRPACVNYQGFVVWRAASLRTLQILQGWCGAANFETFAKPAHAFEPGNHLRPEHQNLNSQHVRSPPAPHQPNRAEHRAQGGPLGVVKYFYLLLTLLLTASYEHEPPAEVAISNSLSATLRRAS